MKDVKTITSPVIHAIMVGCIRCDLIDDFENYDEMMLSKWMVNVEWADKPQAICPSCGVEDCPQPLAIFFNADTQRTEDVRETMSRVFEQVRERQAATLDEQHTCLVRAMRREVDADFVSEKSVRILPSLPK